MNALKLSGYFEDAGEKELIICGNLFDRGTEERELQQFRRYDCRETAYPGVGLWLRETEEGKT